MSRTNRASKPAGFEFWSRRPGNKGGGGRGPFAKRLTHHRERRIARRQCRRELEAT
jgi:hypothetical protein